MRRLLIVPALALASAAFGLTLGDKAPPLTAETTVKGSKVDLSKGVHVVEFWATWCGPCRVSIPHLSEMAQKYKGKVDFTGVSVWENGPDQLGQVKKFVDAMGPKMAYNVAWDGEKKSMAKGWMMAAKQNGIPAAFLVKDGKVLWIGHPMAGLDTAIDQVLAGKYDVAEAKAKYDADMAERAKMEKEQAEMATLMKPFSTAMKAKDYPAALKALDDVEAQKPDTKTQLEPTRLMVLWQANDPKLLECAKALAADPKTSPATLNQIAWSLIDPEMKGGATPQPEAALVLSKRAAEATDMKDPSILDTYAWALYKTGDKKAALETQTKAVDLAKADKETDAAALKEMETRLATYKAEA